MERGTARQFPGPVADPSSRRGERAPGGPTDSDRLLMGRIRDGHRDSLRLLIKRYWVPLVTYGSSLLERPDDAEDVAQETFVRVWRSRTEWSPSGTVSAYLYQINRNLALNWKRDGRTRSARETAAEVAFRYGHAPATPHEQLDQRCLEQDIQVAIAALPDRRREVFVLSRFHGLNHREIAQTMGISTQTVANQMTAALAELRITLADHLEHP